MHVPETQMDYFLLKPDIDNMRCPGANFGEAPSCSGSGCIPCYQGHLSKLHPQDEVHGMIHQMILKWQGLLGPLVDTVKPENPIKHGSYA